MNSMQYDLARFKNVNFIEWSFMHAVFPRKSRFIEDSESRYPGEKKKYAPRYDSNKTITSTQWAMNVSTVYVLRRVSFHLPNSGL